MALRLNGQTSGYVELEAPAVAGSNTLTLPNGNGTSGQYLQTNGSGGLSWATVTDTTTNLTRGTAQTLSGSEVTFSSLPSGIRRITLLVDQASTTSGFRLRVRVGTGGSVATTGYSAVAAYNGTTKVDSTTEWPLNFASAGDNFEASVKIENITGNVWVCTHVGASGNWSTTQLGGGRISLGGVLDTLSISLDTGTFDAGTVNVFYEV